MKSFTRFSELPITCIKPRGWLREYLLRQRDGLTGHLEHAGYPFNGAGWSSTGQEGKHGEVWWPYEQTGYWIDGMMRCGLLLGDKFLINKARRHIEFVLKRADRDGYLGPKFMRQDKPWNRWPHAVFFRAMQAYADATGDKRIVKAMQKHYRCSDPKVHGGGRNVANVENLLWVYSRTGSDWLLKHALEAYAHYDRVHVRDDNSLKNMLSPKRAKEHGVTYNELGKLGAILFMYTGRKKFLKATANAFAKMQRDQELISGVPSSTEHLQGKAALDSHETCDIADYTWGVGYLMLATGDAVYADTIERACFNAAPGAVKSDFKALQYFSCPNQVVADATSNYHELFRGHAWMSYRPNPGTECCPGEVNRIMPNFAARMWLSDGRGGLVAALYGPSSVTAPVGKAGQQVSIIQRTNYPFSDTIDFAVKAAKPVRFRLSLRIPAWCKDARVLVNGRAIKARPKAGTFVQIEREFRDGDRVQLTLPMEVGLTRWPDGGVGIVRGPLAYSLRIKEDWRIDRKEKRSTRQFPAWNLYAASPWNYALALSGRRLEGQVEVTQKPMSDDPWSFHGAPVELRVPARQVRGWKLLEPKSIIVHTWDPVAKKNAHRRVKGRYRFTPPLPDAKSLLRRLAGKVETITLVPYGCTHLRVTIFPQGPAPAGR